MKNISIIGSGSLGTHLTELFCRNNLSMFITVSDKNLKKSEKLANKYDVEYSLNDQNIRLSDVIFITVKPNKVREVCEEIKSSYTISDYPKLIVSTAAGVSVNKIQTWTGKQHRIVRCMPNIPISTGDGSIVWTKGTSTADDICFLNDITKGPYSLWTTENMMNPATSISGCGPAYVAKLFQTWYESSIEMGFTSGQSKHLILNSMSGFVKLAYKMQSKEIMNQVASKGGATEKGLEQLDQNGFDMLISDSLFSTLNRIKKITKSLD